MKKIVYRYLDEIFGKSEIRSVDTEYGKMYKAVLGDNEVLFWTQFQTRGNRLTIHFNNNEFKLIKNFFGLTLDDTVDIIRDYLANKVDPILYNSPFYL